MNVLGISRSPRFSPNSVDRDMAIFTAVASRMQRGGNDVSIISEDLFIAVDLSEFDLVFSMARGRDVLTALAEAEQQLNLRVVNSAHGLLQANRAQLVTTLKDTAVPQPKLQILNIESSEEHSLQELSEELILTYPLWLKRGDACAQRPGDVCFVSNQSELHQALISYAANGVHAVIAEEHVPGDLVKFYGVEGSDFFFITYPTETNNFSKFGLEQHNGKPLHIPFDANMLKSAANRAAKSIGCIVYGGDAIISADGKFVVIDFNDWPSFSACRKEAAKAIANRLKNLD